MFGLTRCKQALLVWLEEMKKAGVPVVLVDSPDRVSPRRLVKDNDTDTRGVLTLEEIAEVVERSRQDGIHVLSSGGITPRQAFSLASLGVFGIFTTSSTARPAPVSGGFVNDPVLAFENEPTEPGVRRVHALIQAGFLTGRGKLDPSRITPLREAADRLIDATADNQAPILKELDQLLLAAWPYAQGGPTGDDSTRNESAQKFIEWRIANRIPPDRHRTFGIHYTDPRTTPPEDHHMDICVAVDRPVAPNPQGVIDKVIAGGRCAVARHIGPREFIAAAALLVEEWLPASGESRRDAPIFFHYVNVGPDVLEHEMITDVYLPLR